jgi:hypothetical protein
MKEIEKLTKKRASRRSFFKNGMVAAGAITVGSGLLGKGMPAFAAEEKSGSLTRGDAAILRWLAAAEIIETDLWKQYNELGGIQDSELPEGSGSKLYTTALKVLDGDMDQYIHDNTEDELTHEQFINAYLAMKGADIVDLSKWATLPSSQADGADKDAGRLTNLMQLTVDTSWWTRYRSRTKNPDFGDSFPDAVPTLHKGQHTAIPRTNDDVTSDPKDPTKPSAFLQAIANTAGFHFPFIEQGGTSLYAMLAQRVTSGEVLRIVLSIGGTENLHFQTWHDKAGNAPPLTNVKDPKTGVLVTFPDFSNSGEDLKKNLIMPEPTIFLKKDLPKCSIVRPTHTAGAAMGALTGLTKDGLFIGHVKNGKSDGFLEYLKDLAEDADEAIRECE